MNDIRISERIPHGEGMCLIDEVVDYDEHTIHCRTRSHRRPDNPLAEDGRLSSVILIEYAAQVAAIHAALSRSGLDSGRPAYIGQVKSVHLLVSSIEAIDGDLEITGNCVLSQNNGAVYRFEVHASKPIAHGQLNLIKPAQAGNS